MRKLLARLNRRIAAATGRKLMPTAGLYPWQVERLRGPFDAASLPPGAAEWLRPDHPALADLRRRYAACDIAATKPFKWREGALSAEDLLYFRGCNAYVWQNARRNDNELSAALCYHALKADDREGLLDRLDEDLLFGVHGHPIDGRIVSRDLLDSAREIQFLIRHAGLGDGPRTLLDIGAGYGRLAWRLEQALGESIQVFATDAFPASTFICDYYLRFRGATRSRAVPLDGIGELLGRERIDIATNIHSFPECTLDAIAWWLERLARHHVRHLLIVPNDPPSDGDRLRLNDGRDFEHLVERFGYRRVAREPRYPDPFVQRYGLDPVHLNLFEFGGA